MVVLIDMGSVFWRAWHRNNEDPEAARVDALAYVRGHVERADVVAACFDAPPYERQAAFPQYKATRPPKPAEAIQALRDVETDVGDMCHVLSAKGHEADDVLATAAQWCDDNGEPCRIFSADKDLMQAADVAEVVKLDGTPFDLNGLTASQVADYLAIAGDTSDNVPGIDGIGGKKALQLLKAFGNVSMLMYTTPTQIQALPGFGPAAVSAIHEAFGRPEDEDPIAIRELVRLRRDVPIDCSVLTQPIRPEEETMPEYEDHAENFAADYADRGAPVPAEAPAPPESAPAVEGEPVSAPMAMVPAPEAMPLAHPYDGSGPPAQPQGPQGASSSIGRLAFALARAQGQIHSAKKSARGYGYSYADLASVWDVIRKPLADNELAVVQQVNGDHVVTTLVHSSGEWIASNIKVIAAPVTSKGGKEVTNPAQTYGSGLTYARRYALAALVGVAQDDDDAAGSHGQQRRRAG